MGVGAEPVDSQLDHCSAAHPIPVPVRALSMLFPGSQLIPQDSCSLWSLAAGQDLIPDRESYGMLKGYFPKGPTLVPAPASLGDSPEWDPGWVSASIEHLGWDSGKWEIGSRGQNGGKPQGLGHPGSLLPPRTAAAAVAFPGTLVLRWLGVSSQPGIIHPLHLVFFWKAKPE